MQNNFLPLGAATPAKTGVCLAISPQKLSDKERIKILEDQVSFLSAQIAELRSALKKDSGAAKPEINFGNLNKDGIPIGTVCTGATEKSPFLFYLTVHENSYQIGWTQYESLSAAAEAVSKVRRSGWTFWRIEDGRTLKEAYKR